MATLIMRVTVIILAMVAYMGGCRESGPFYGVLSNCSEEHREKIDKAYLLAEWVIINQGEELHQCMVGKMGPTLADEVYEETMEHFFSSIRMICRDDWRMGDALARAPINTVGNRSVIRWNKLGVEDSKLVYMAGSLVHELAHNAGYNHPPISEGRCGVPYQIGDCITELVWQTKSP